MANFGTPTVIGTLTSSTSQTSYTVPITATTGLGDGIFIVVSSGGTGSNNIPSVVSDSQNPQNYTQLSTIGTPGQLTTLQLLDSRVLTNTDTVTVTFPVANTFLKSIAVIDCPGAIALDVGSILTNSGSSANPTITTNASGNPELVFFVTDNSNLGGAPSGFSPFTNLVTLHSGSGPWTSVSYQIVNSPGPVTATETITSSSWTAISAGFLANIPLYNIQQPFEVGLLPLTLAFNPLLQFKSPPPQPAIPTVISSAPVNITGAQANVFTPGINFLTGNNANFTSGQGGWTNGGGTTIAQVATPTHNNTGALQLTATAPGSINALSSTAGKIIANGMPCNPGDTIFAAAWVLAATTPRAASIGISSLAQDGTINGSTSFGSSVTDSTGVWQLVTVTTTASAIATTNYARISVQFAGAATSESHYISDVWLFNLSSGSGMGELIQVFQVENQQFLLSPNGLPRPMNLNPAFFGLQRQVGTALPTVFQPGVTANVNVSAGAGAPTIQVVTWPQFPFNSPLPSPFDIVPSLAYLRPQTSVTPPTVFIDGGIGGQVAVNAQFPDIAVVVSVTADPPPNVSVTAPTPPTVITGATATVNVTAPTGNEVVIVMAASAVNVSVSAIAGSITESIIGSVANVNAAAVAGVATVTPVGIPAQVNVAAQNGSIREAVIGTAGNVNVASTGTAVVTPQGTTGLVSAQAIAGTPTDVIPGHVSTVAVASSGSVEEDIPGATANVSVAAIPGVPGKTIQGVTANVSVASIASAQVAITGVSQNVSVSAIAGSVPKSVQGVTATVNVVAPAGLAGLIDIEATLSNPDLAEDIILSRQGKLLDVPVKNMLVSADEI